MQSGFSRLDRRYRHFHQNVEHAAPAIPPNTSVRCARVLVTPPNLNRAFDKAFHFKTSQKFGLKAIYGCLLDFSCYLQISINDQSEACSMPLDNFMGGK